jgi:hypothetical protein
MLLAVAQVVVAACVNSADRLASDSGDSAPSIKATVANPGELPTWKIPNIPESAEAYYAPDNLHVVAQTRDARALVAEGRSFGSLTWTFTDQGTDIRKIGDRGQDACSYFTPDGEQLVWTSTRDNMDMPPGNWSNSNDYPQGAELYVSDLDGGNLRRLTDNQWYEAEIANGLFSVARSTAEWIFGACASMAAMNSS